MAKVLVIGSGGREHALCWRLKQSPSVTDVFCAPGNGGIAEDAVCVDLGSHQEIISFCKNNAIDLVVVGPEKPLTDGITDALAEVGIASFGPGANAARLEGSKGYMKSICQKYNIPTAAYGYFHDADSAKAFLVGKSYPIVVKADGLAAGKGVIIAQNEAEAVEAVQGMFAGYFGESGKSVVIEEFLDGEEVSFFALSDGTHAVEFGYAQDHKRAFDGDQGPNTGGMGAFSPASILTASLREIVMRDLIQPTVDGMKKEGAPFRGVLFAGLMLTSEGPKLLEYNVRFGDPETQVLMARFNADLYKVLLACSPVGMGRESLQNVPISFSDESAVCVVMAASGYPGDYQKGSVIRGLDKAGRMEKTKVFHAGTEKRGPNMVAIGGRVLGVTAIGAGISDAQKQAYKAVDMIDWPEGFCRRDIGWRAIKH